MITKNMGWEFEIIRHSYTIADINFKYTVKQDHAGAILGIGLFGLFGYIVSNVILGVWFSIVLGVFFFTDIGIIGLTVIGAWASIFMVQFAAGRRYDRNLSTEHKNRPDNFIKNAYKGWKEKYCSKITFVGADNKLKVKFFEH